MNGVAETSTYKALATFPFVYKREDEKIERKKEKKTMCVHIRQIEENKTKKEYEKNWRFEYTAWPVQILHALLYIIQIILCEANGFCSRYCCFCYFFRCRCCCFCCCCCCYFPLSFYPHINRAYTVHFLLLSLFISFFANKGAKNYQPTLNSRCGMRPYPRYKSKSVC